VLAFLACTALLPAQGGKPAAPDPEVAAKIEQLKEVVADRKMARDAEGIDVITVLVKKWQGGLVDKDQKEVIKGLGAVFTQGKVREPDKMQLYKATATAIGQLGEQGGKPLEAAYTNKQRFPEKREWVPLREDLLRAIGKTKDSKLIKFMTDIARRDPEAALQAAAGEALGNFEDSPVEVRKEIVNNLLIRYGEMDSRSRQIDPADIEAQNMRDRLAVIAGRWNETLRKLTRQNLDQYPEWQEWYNKNKSKDEQWK
jgi:hypothetical protein